MDIQPLTKTFKQDYPLKQDEQYMNHDMLNYFKNKLNDWKEELIRQSASIKDSIEQQTAREPDHVDEAIIEETRDTEYYFAKRDIVLINEIDQALNRIDTGCYGYCKVTGEEIGVDRLNAWPIARLIVSEQNKQERQ